MFSGIYSGSWGVSPVRMGQGMVVAIGYSFTTGHTLIHISPSRTGLPALSPHSMHMLEINRAAFFSISGKLSWPGSPALRTGTHYFLNAYSQKIKMKDRLTIGV